MRQRRIPSVLLCLVALGTITRADAADWPPIRQEELAMADNPSDPGSAAILLFRESIADDTTGVQTEYRRIKVFNDEGKKYADIEIPYLESATRIEAIRARTIRPDGTAVEFQGQIFDRTVVKGRKIRLQSKTLTLPDVQKGSIIEYSYTIRSRHKAPDLLRNPGSYIALHTVTVLSASWQLQESLFTRRARFSLRPFPKLSLQWILRYVSNAHPQPQADGTTSIEVENIAAFKTEEHMLPEEWLRSSVTFFYQFGPPLTNAYWERIAAEMTESLTQFLGKPDKLKKDLAGVIAAGDSPETQLRKLYARVQQLRYLSYEPFRTEREAKRENLKENKNVEDVLKHGYAYANEINLALVALARGAGFDAAPVMVKSRDTGLFAAQIPDPGQLDAMVVWVKAGGKDYFLDPATRYCPFDLLPWEESDTSGIVLAERHDPSPVIGGSSNSNLVVTTPGPTSAMAVIERNAVLQLDAGGGVEGTVVVTFAGHDALERRIAARGRDEAARKKSLEEEVKGWVSPAATVELNGPVNWEQSEQPLRSTFSVKVPDYATPTGRRLLFRSGFFEGSANSFRSATRIHDIYFAYPFEEADDIVWTLPPGYKAANLPDNKVTRTEYGNYRLTLEGADGGLRSKRRFTVQKIYVPKIFYPAIRAYFNIVRAGDAEQVILDRAEAPDAGK